MKEISASDFDKLKEREDHFILHFWAKWNGWDIDHRRVLEDLEQDFTDIKFCQMEVDIPENKKICELHRVMGPPTTVMYMSGKLVKREVGILSREVLIDEWLECQQEHNKDSIDDRGIGSSAKLPWESIAGVLCLLLYFFIRPPIMDNGIPYLLESSPVKYVIDFILLASALGFGFSAARCNRGRHTGIITCLVAIALLSNWLHLLINWKQRWWG